MPTKSSLDAIFAKLDKEDYEVQLIRYADVRFKGPAAHYGKPIKNHYQVILHHPDNPRERFSEVGKTALGTLAKTARKAFAYRKKMAHAD